MKADGTFSGASAPKPRLLLVEDELKLRQYLLRALSEDYLVTAASNGKEALEAVEEFLPDLVITDIVMPELGGIELLKALRSAPRTRMIPVLLISGRALDEQRIEGFEQGADGYLAKPYTERELRAYIGSLLQSARWRGEAARREALEQALAERTALLESITDAFYTLDSEFRFTYLNQRALDHFGKAREALLGQVVWDVFPSTQGTPFQAQYEHAVRTQAAVAFEAMSVISNRWVEVRGYPTPQGLAVYFRDVTDRKDAEERLHEADRRKSEFLAILSHELRNPLATLRSGLDILKLPGSQSALERTVAMMDRQMRQLVSLVDDLLDVSRITSGRLELRRSKVPIMEVLDRAMEGSRPFLEAKQHQLVTDLRATDLWVDGDPTRLTQVFCNLLSNSAKYTNRGGRIAITLMREGSEAVIWVEDTGIGIPQAALERVFDMFARGAAHDARDMDGLGIGLALVRTLVQMHGGVVEAFSEGESKGSRFTVRLPVIDAPERVER